MQGLTLASAILMWQCACVERSVPALWMTKYLLAAADRLKDCINPWKLVNGPASAVVASMMRFGWQVPSGTEYGAHKGVLSFASVGHGELHDVLHDAYHLAENNYSFDALQAYCFGINIKL